MADGPSSSPGRIALLVQRVVGGRAEVPSSLAELRGSETAKAVGLAAAMIGNNVIALGSTVVFSRLLKDNQGGGYGSLAALVSYFLILSVVGPGACRWRPRARACWAIWASAPALMATVRRWTRGLLLFTLALTVISVLLRDPIAGRSASSTTPGPRRSASPPPACGWSSRCCAACCRASATTRASASASIGEQGARLVVGAILAAAGLGVTGAYLGTPLSFIAMGLYCAHRLRQHVPRADGGAEPRAVGQGARSGAQPLGARPPRLGADRRADRDRRAAEHRHHRRQAPLHHAHRQLLRRPSPSPPRCSSGWRWAPASTSCPRSRGAAPLARIRGRYWSGRWGSSLVCAIPVLLIFAVAPTC